MAISFRAGTSVTIQNTNATLTIPGTVQVGDLMLAAIHTANSGTLTVPTGWTALPGTGSGHIESATNWYSQIVYKVATAPDAGSTVTWVVGAGPKSTILFAAYSGVDQSAPIDVAAMAQGTASTSHATPSVTVTQLGWLVSFCSDFGSPSSTALTQPGGYTVRASGFATGGASASAAIADSAANVSNGAQTSGTWTATLSTANSVVASIALKPSSTAGITGTVKWYGRSALRLLAASVNLTSDTLKVTAHTSTYSPNLDTHDFYDDLANELSTANGYTAGGKTLTTVSVSQDATNHRVIITCDPMVWTVPSGTLGPIRYFVVRKDTGVAATSPLLFLIDCGTDASSTVAIGIYPDPTSGLEIVSTPIA